MKKHRCLLLTTAVLLTVSGTATVTHAAVTHATLSSVGAAGAPGVDMTYAADASNSDLLHGLTGSYSGWQLTNSFNPANLNNGTYGATSVGQTPNDIAFAANTGTTATYTLGPGTGFGYAIDSIVSLASWRDGALYQQNYQIWTRNVGSLTFDLAYTVGNDLNPVADINGGGSSKVTVSESGGGFVAYGIDAIRFVILDIPAGFEPTPGGGSTTFREIDVFGSAVIPEPGSAALLLGAAFLGLGVRRRSSQS